MATWAEVRRIEKTSFGRVSVIANGEAVPNGHTPRIRFVDLAGVAPVPAVGWFYDHSAGAFSETPPGAVPKPAVKPAALWFKRVTNTERGKIFALSQADAGGITLNLVQRGRLQAFLMFSVANDTQLDNAEAEFIFNALETIGALTAGRAAEILGD